MKTFATICLCSLFLWQAHAARGASILDVTGDNDATRVLLPGDAAAAAFNLSAPLRGLSISADLGCSNCSAVAYLTSGLDLGFDPATDLIAISGVTGTDLFSGIDLDAGTYFLVIGNSLGALLWDASKTPAVTGSGAADRIVDFFADDTANLAPASRFTALADSALHYRLTVVPVPATALLSFTALAALAFAAAGRRR